MGKHVFKKPEPSTVRGLCVLCGLHPQKSRVNVGGETKYKTLCASCNKKRCEPGGSGRPYRKFVDSECHVCGFTSSHPCQFDIDHKDGNQENNALDNIWTLCANCHRLKTWIQVRARKGLPIPD
jgi:hypothetical protein